MSVKKRVFLLVCTMLFLVGMVSYSLFFNVKVNASANVAITYEPFTDLFYVISYDDNENVGTAYHRASINQTTYLLEWVNNDSIINLYGAYVFESNTMYLVKGSFDGSRDYDFESDYVIKYDEYLLMYYNNGYYSGYSDGVAVNDYQDAYNSGYDNGYGVGYNANSSESYSRGYDDGYADGQYLYSYGQQGYNQIFNAGKQAQLQEDIESEETGLNLSFYHLLSTIVMFPYQVVKEGMNVDIFDINIGGVIIGLFMLSLVLFIVRLFLKGGSK